MRQPVDIELKRYKGKLSRSLLQPTNDEECCFYDNHPIMSLITSMNTPGI